MPPASETAPAHLDTPARQVLNNQELASLIVSYFSEAENAKDDNKKALAQVATLNKSFFHASTDIFWRQMPSVSPFLRLLPLFPSDERAAIDRTMDAVHNGDAWERFRFYHRKTVQLELSDDKTIGKAMPNHWFFTLMGLPSRPPVLFPKLTELAVTSIAGLNSVLPFHIPQGLRHVTIKDFSVNNNYDGLKKHVLTSLMTSFARNERGIQSMTIKSFLTPAMTSSFQQFTALNTLSITFPSPFPLDHLACLNTLPQLKKLTLLSRGCVGVVQVPPEGQHLNQWHPRQGKSSVTDLVIGGDGFFIFWCTVFLASSSLIHFHGRTPSTHHNPVQGVFLAPHALDILSKRCPNLKRIRMEWDEPTSLELAMELDVFVDEPAYRIPADLFRSFAKLKNLAYLDFKNLPSVSREFGKNLLANTWDMKQLATLRIQQRPLHIAPHNTLEHPTLEVLRVLATKNPALRHAYLTCNMQDIPAEPVDLDAVPLHKLQTLFITPRGRRQADLQMHEAMAMAKYILAFFPDIQDITSWFEPGKGGDVVVPGTKVKPLGLWKSVDMAVKEFQRYTRQFAARAAARGLNRAA